MKRTLRGETPKKLAHKIKKRLKLGGSEGKDLDIATFSEGKKGGGGGWASNVPKGSKSTSVEKLGTEVHLHCNTLVEVESGRV